MQAGRDSGSAHEDLAKPGLPGAECWIARFAGAKRGRSWRVLAEESLALAWRALTDCAGMATVACRMLTNLEDDLSRRRSRPAAQATPSRRFLAAVASRYMEKLAIFFVPISWARQAEVAGASPPPGRSALAA